MKNEFDFKKEWDKTKDQLTALSKEATKWAQKGEKEFVKISHRSKLHLDSTAANLKREHLFYLIGKEYSRIKDPARPTAKLNELMAELRSVNKEYGHLSHELKKK